MPQPDLRPPAGPERGWAVPLASWPAPARFLAVGVVYVGGVLLLHSLAFNLFATGTAGALWYPAAGLHVVLVLLYGRAYVPLLLLPGLLRYALGITSNSLTMAVLYSLVIMVVYGGGGLYLREGLRIDPRLRRFRSAALLLGVGGLGIPLLAGVTVATVAVSTGFVPPGAWIGNALAFWVGDATGVGMLAPLLLIALLRPARVPVRPPEALGQAAALVLTLWLAFGGYRGTDVAYAYLMFIPALWIADRRGLAGASVAVLVANVGAVVALSARLEAIAPTALQFHFILFTFATLFLGAAADERRRLIREAQAARARAERSERLKAQLLANLSHEVRTPLTAIMGFAEIMQEHADEEFSDIVGGLIRNGHRVIGTLNAMLEWSLIQEGRAALDLEPVDVRAAVEEVALSFENDARRKGLALRVEQPEAPLVARVDARYVASIVSNLVSNAIKFTREGSVCVTTAAEGGAVVIAVSDTGVGIAPEFLPRLFEAYEQESTGEGRRFEGVGLGLAITSQFVDAMGGTVEVESEQGAGTTFRVQFPLEAPVAVPQPSL